MHPPFSRLAAERRASTEAAIARVLASGLGEGRAREEARELVERFDQSSGPGHLAALMQDLGSRVSRWESDGIPPAAREEAMGLLAQAPWIPRGAAREADVPLELQLQHEIGQRAKFAALLTVSRAVVNTLDLKTILSTIAKQIRQVIQT